MMQIIGLVALGYFFGAGAVFWVFGILVALLVFGLVMNVVGVGK